MSAGRLPLERREELLAEIQRGRLPAWARDAVHELVAGEYRSIAALAGANSERQAQVRAGIHRAADRHLTEPMRRITRPRSWTGALWLYLERRYADFGLERRPCKRVVREALKEWTPPIGGARLTGYPACNFTEEAHG